MLLGLLKICQLSKRSGAKKLTPGILTRDNLPKLNHH